MYAQDAQLVQPMGDLHLLAVLVQDHYLHYAATEIHALGLRFGWHRISGKDQIVLPGIALTHHQHGLQHLPVGGQQNEVISIP